MSAPGNERRRRGPAGPGQAQLHHRTPRPPGDWSEAQCRWGPGLPRRGCRRRRTLGFLDRTSARSPRLRTSPRAQQTGSIRFLARATSSRAARSAPPAEITQGAVTRTRPSWAARSCRAGFGPQGWCRYRSVQPGGASSPEPTSCRTLQRSTAVARPCATGHRPRSRRRVARRGGRCGRRAWHGR